MELAGDRLNAYNGWKIGDDFGVVYPNRSTWS